MFYPSQTTHIVCTVLAGAKVGSMLRRIRSQSRRTIHVVKPEWVLKSYEMKKRLPERDFSLILPNVRNWEGTKALLTNLQGGSSLDSFMKAPECETIRDNEDADGDVIDIDLEPQLALPPAPVMMRLPLPEPMPAPATKVLTEGTKPAHPLKSFIATSSQKSKLQPRKSSALLDGIRQSLKASCSYISTSKDFKFPNTARPSPRAALVVTEVPKGQRQIKRS